MRKILIVLFVIAIVALTVEAADARGPRHHHGTTTEDMMMVAAQQTAEGDAQKAYEVYKEMKRIEVEEQKQSSGGASAAFVVFLLAVVGVISAICFIKILDNDRRVSWVALFIAISSISLVILWFLYPGIII